MSSMRKVTSWKIDCTKRWVAHTQCHRFIGLIGRSSGCPRSIGCSSGHLSLSHVLLSKGGHALPVLHRGHVEHPPGDVLELSSGHVDFCHLCIAGNIAAFCDPLARLPRHRFQRPSVLSIENVLEPSFGRVIRDSLITDVYS